MSVETDVDSVVSLSRHPTSRSALKHASATQALQPTQPSNTADSSRCLNICFGAEHVSWPPALLPLRLLLPWVQSMAAALTRASIQANDPPATAAARKASSLCPALTACNALCRYRGATARPALLSGCALDSRLTLPKCPAAGDGGLDELSNYTWPGGSTVKGPSHGMPGRPADGCRGAPGTPFRFRELPSPDRPHTAVCGLARAYRVRPTGESTPSRSFEQSVVSGRSPAGTRIEPHSDGRLA